MYVHVFRRIAILLGLCITLPLSMLFAAEGYASISGSAVTDDVSLGTASGIRRDREQQLAPYASRDTDVISQTYEINRCCGTPGTQRSSLLDFRINLTTHGVLRMQYNVPAIHCSDIRLHILVDDQEVRVTEFIGPVSGIMTTGSLDLGPVASGEHSLTLSPEGRIGGCNTGWLYNWFGTLIVNTDGSIITGRVTDASGHGIPGVTVWAGPTRSTTTDANGNYTFAGLSAGTYNLRAEKAGYAICPHTSQVTLPPDATGQNFTGLPATASLGFCPSSDGYKFSNSDSGWGSYPAPPAWGDLTMADTRRMCGDQAVCLSPWLPGLPCAYKLSAETWNFIVNLGMIKGHCAGMAATSLRFFKDIDQPSDFQAGASTTFALDLLGETRRNIAYYQAEQSALPILSYKLSQQHTSTPVQTLDALRVAMAGDASDPVVLVLKSGENQHAVTPIALEDRGNGIWAVWVYDNELPGSASTVMINTLNNTWSRGSWSGDASSHSLYVIAMSLFNGEQTCPFSLSPVTAATLSSESPNGQIWLTENANLLITDSLGRRLGYVGDQLVSEIPGADRIDFIVGTSHPAIPVYSIPLTETYTMLLDGHPLAETQTLQIAQFGPGYAASIENVLVSPTTRDHLAIAADGSQLQYRASTGKEATLKLAQDGTNESYQLSLRDVELHANKTITLTNDTSIGRLVFANNPGASNSYDLAITRATATTGAKRFYHADLTADPGDVQSFDYRAWDGSGSLVMQIDHNGDGVIDETQLLENQIKKIYLPLVFRK